MITKPIRFYTDKPIFGLDIGRSSLKVMQLDNAQDSPEIAGYGTADFDIRALNEGVIVKPEAISIALHDLFEHRLAGEITTRRVAMALPGYRTFTRSIQLPDLGQAELKEAVELEVEQYVPMQIEDLYLDYVVTSSSPTGKNLFVVAVPKRIVDSYLTLATKLGLEPILIEPTMTAGARFFARDKHSDITSVIIDFGSLTATISIYDKTIVATSTVSAGGLVFTEAIRNQLGVSQEEAGDIKTKFGLDVSKYQKQIAVALEPSLGKIVTEVRRMLRYYEEHYPGQNGIGQIVTLGGGANMPGLSDYLTNALKVPVRTHEHPWAVFKYDHDLGLPIEADRLMYATVAGLSLLNPKAVFES
ncbi:MAG TPA: type IV pilus assembly protein PilM [Candidatus Pristimantibacillus sp.]|jgi:type IV pilus assembly protein PilM|nr:type IV pilus assembly protein PilM [Candidatus Pristimantibacillus sp.]